MSRPALPVALADTHWHRGVGLASVLELEWVRALEALGMPWLPLSAIPGHAPDARRLTCWLPAANQFFCVASPTLTTEDFESFLRLDASMIAAERAAAAALGEDDEAPAVHLVLALARGDFHCLAGGRWIANDAALFSCWRCGGRWFADARQGWACRCCGAAEGNGTPGRTLERPLRPWPLTPDAFADAWAPGRRTRAA